MGKYRSSSAPLGCPSRDLSKKLSASKPPSRWLCFLCTLSRRDYGLNFRAYHRARRYIEKLGNLNGSVQRRISGYAPFAYILLSDVNHLTQLNLAPREQNSALDS
jgi:hypothetical protein